ncbi:MAG: ATP phosphoribosyltransferase regulatory subunit [Pseudomonadota bacterium]
MSAFESIASRGGNAVSPDIVLPASVPLELSGEVVRGRICTFVDEAGMEWALRPDLTLPVALTEIDLRRGGVSGETQRYYQGSVFRLPSLSSEPLEFAQVGVERFGTPRTAESDADLYATMCAACQADGVESGRTTFGDLALFPGFVDAMDLSPERASGLKRAFRQEGGVKAYLDAEENGQGSGLSRRFSGMSRDQIADAVEDVFAMTGVQPVGERGTDEIVERLAERAAGPSGDALSPEQRSGLEAFLSLEARFEDAADCIAELAKAAGVPSDIDVINHVRHRCDAILKTAPEGFLKDARFLTEFGRRFTYYDGFVFEIAQFGDAHAAFRPFASGGRYDSLLSGLSSGEVEATALGGVVLPHRLTAAKGGPA